MQRRDPGGLGAPRLELRAALERGEGRADQDSGTRKFAA